MAESVIRTANKRVPIELACRLAGTDMPEVIDRSKSLKVRCPFGPVYHDDGGSEAALRVYPGPNNAWCFACGEFFTPVKMCSMAWDVSYETAALNLLDRIGYKPASFAHHWQAVTAPLLPDGASIAQALKFACERMEPDWAQAQQDPVVAEYLAKCLGLVASITSESEAEQWLGVTQQVMHDILERRREVIRGAKVDAAGS